MNTFASWSAFSAMRRSARWPERRRLWRLRCTIARAFSKRRASRRISSVRSDEAAGSAPPASSAQHQGSPEIEQIIHGLSRTTARIWVVDREQNVLARAGTLKRSDPISVDTGAGDSRLARAWIFLEREALQPLYARMLPQPSEDFNDDGTGRTTAAGRDVEGALAGILTIDRRPTADGRAVIVSAAHPIWVGDEVKGAVIVEETTNAVLAERNRAFARLFTIVLAALLIGSVALTLYASWLSSRIRRLRDEAEAAIDAQRRARGL